MRVKIMLETLKKLATKACIIRIIISAVIIVALLAVTKFAIFDVITGPTKIDMTKDPAQYEGKYVTIEVENLLTDYVEHYTETTYKSGAKSTKTDGNSYIAFYADLNNVWYYYSFFLSKNKTDAAYNMIDQTWEYWNDTTYTVQPPEPMVVTGTWTKLEGTMLSYYDSTITTDLGITEDSENVFLRYTIDTEKIGGWNAGVFWLLQAGALLALLYLIWNIVKMITNAHLKGINKYLHDNGNVSVNNLEADFASAHQVGKTTWVGKKWTISMQGPKAKIMTNKDGVWAYYYRRTGRNSVSELRVYLFDKRLHTIPLSEAHTKEVLGYYSSEQPQMVVGYTDELEKMYNKNFQEFLNLKYNPAKQQELENPYGSFDNNQ